MAAFTVPGLKSSKGQQGFKSLDQGEYEMKCLECTVKEDDKSPTDIIMFKFEVLGGPPQSDGAAAKGKKHVEFVRIKRETHPQFDQAWLDPTSGKTQMGVDQLKSMMVAMGVAAKGDNFNPAAFAGQACKVSLVHTVNKNDTDKFYVNSRNWSAIG